MKSLQPRMNLIVLSIAFFGVATALIQYRLHYSGLLSADFSISFYAFLLISFILSVLIACTKRMLILFALLALRSFFLFLFSYPFTSYLGIELTLNTVLIIEAGLRLPHPHNFAAMGLLALVAVAFQFPIDFFNQTILGRGNSPVSLHDIFSFTIYLAAILLLTAVINRLGERYREALRQKQALHDSNIQLSRANTDFQQYANVADEQATLNERKRITREIHDISGYIFTNIISLMEVGISLGSQNQDKLTELLYQVRTQAQEGLRETRRALRELRAEAGGPERGIKAIKKIVQTFEKVTGVKANLELSNMQWSYGDELDLLIFRIVQEALTNAFRHGHATSIDVHFWDSGDELIINIIDNGRGDETIKQGMGLLGMQERMDKIGGKIAVGNVKGGFKLSAWIPLRRGAA